MTAARALASIRIVIASIVAVAIARSEPDLARLFGSFAAAHSTFDRARVGWLGAYATNLIYAAPLRYGALAGASVLAAILAAWLVERRARRIVSRPWALVAAALALLGSLDTLRTGGGTATLAFAAAMMLLLEDLAPQSIVALGGVTLLWCNVEAAGLLAPAFTVVAALGRRLDRCEPSALRRAWLAAAVAAGATLVTPLGFAFPGHAVAALRLAGASAEYAAWAPADVAPQAYRLGVMLLIALALGFGARGRGARDAALAAFACLVAFASGALVGVFGIVAAPIVVGAIAGRNRDGRDDARDAPRGFATGSIAGIVVLSLTTAFFVGSRAVPIARDAPYAAIDRLARVGGVRRIFCSNLAWCDAAVARGMAVVADGRVANAPRDAREAQIAILRAQPAWRTKLDGLGVDVAIAGVDSALATLLTARRWTRFATAGKTIVLRRPQAAL